MLDSTQQEPFALLCLYIQSLPQEEREKLNAADQELYKGRFEAKVINSLAKQNLIKWYWQRSEVALTPNGNKMAETLIKEIIG